MTIATIQQPSYPLDSFVARACFRAYTNDIRVVFSTWVVWASGKIEHKWEDSMHTMRLVELGQGGMIFPTRELARSHVREHKAHYAENRKLIAEHNACVDRMWETIYE